jgi:protocatechuate 3,4-dioxygenase beta subunit
MKSLRYALVFVLFLASFALFAELAETGGGEACKPTEPDMLGPFYKAGAPVRPSIGKGYVMTGTVKSAGDCSAIKRARIEFWLVNPDGSYDDDHRATVFSDTKGSYRFESNTPKPYFGRPPHIHARVSAEGYETLVTQHYPEKGKDRAIFDLVLVPSRQR